MMEEEGNEYSTTDYKLNWFVVYLKKVRPFKSQLSNKAAWGSNPRHTADSYCLNCYSYFLNYSSPDLHKLAFVCALCVF